MVQNKKLRFPYCTLLLLLILRDNPRLLFCFCCCFCSFQTFFWSVQAYTIYCTGESILNRLFCNLFHLTVKSETVPTHMDIVLSSEPFPPLSLWSISFLGFSLLSDLLSNLLLPSFQSLISVFSHRRPCSTSQLAGFGEVSSELHTLFPSDDWTSHRCPKSNTLMFFVKIFSFPSLPFPSCPEKIPFRPHFGVNIQIPSGSE